MNFQTHNWYPWSKTEKERGEGKYNLNIDDIKHDKHLKVQELRTFRSFL